MTIRVESQRRDSQYRQEGRMSNDCCATHGIDDWRLEAS